MKKIININLSGRVIPIEDSAYEKLQAYIESLRRYFSNEEGRDEIINDIESRIAELMNEKVRKGASCVTNADIDEIMASMGRPEDFDAAEADATESTQKQQQNQHSYQQQKAKRRLYRDSSDKFIGGVCSGIAAYMNVDPAIIRILFAIITFGGFGLGFLIYGLLWMILPTKDLEGYKGKRLYRNPEDKVMGGVAGGLAAYLNKETWVIRTIFASPLILSVLLGAIHGFTWDYDFDIFSNIVFGSLSSTFVIIYIVLWMVLPEANTTYEKMEMRGEKVDVNRIRQNVQDGMGNVKDKVKGWTEEVKESAQQFGDKAKEFASTRGKVFAAEVNETARRSGRGLGHAIGVLFKVFFLFIAGTIAFALFVTLMAVIFGGIAWWPVNNFLWTSKWQQIYAWGTLIFFLAVPLIGFITWLIRRIIGVKSRNSYLGWTFGALWTLGWVCATLFATSIGKDFREQEHIDNNLAITQPVNGKMIVAVSAPELEYNGSFGWMNDGGEGWDLSEDTLRLSTVKFNVIRSIDSAYHVVIRRYSFGKNEKDALDRAEKIQFTAVSRDSILDLANGYAIDKSSKFRGQQIEIEIQVPIGKKIRFDQSVPDKLNPMNFKIRSTHRKRTIINNRIITDVSFEDDYFHFRTDIDYVMGADGSLKDPKGNSIKSGDYYRYNDTTNDTLNLQQQLEEEKFRKEESERRIKELEERQKQKPVGELETMDSEDDNASSDVSPSILTLTRWF